MKISFIGYGNMAQAIAKSLGKNDLYTLSASAPSLSRGTIDGKITTYQDNKEVAKIADILILAVKPAQMSLVIKEIKPFIPPHCLLISIAAGLSLSWFEKRLANKQALIRTMPNTPAAVGLAATPMIANQYATLLQKQIAEHIFSSIGLITWINSEEDVDTFTALSGSGPAYVFLFMEAMIEAAISLGLDAPTAKIFALQTFKGAIHLADHSDLSLTEQRIKVTSPGGTTAAALDILHGQLNDLILAAMKAAKIRSHELGNHS